MERSKDEQAQRLRENISQAERTHAQRAEPDLAAQRAGNAEWRRTAGARQVRQAAALVERQDLKRREFDAVHRIGPEASRAHDADTTARHAERARLDAVNEVARGRLGAVDRTELRVLNEQVERIAGMESRHHQELDAARDASPAARRALQNRHQQEASLLAERALAEIRALDEHRNLTNAQIARDAAELEAAMYGNGTPTARAAEQSRVIDRERSTHQELERRAQDQLSEIGVHFERAQERLGSEQAEFGDLRRYADQDRSIRDEGVRTSEHEHVRARINLVLQTIDPVEGRSAYDRAAYRRSATLTIPRDMAVEKTREDLALRDRLKDALDRGVFSEELIRDMTVQADIQRTIEARERAIEARLAEGRDVADLRAITDEAIARAAHYQQAELFEVGTRQSSPIADATQVEVDASIEQLREEA